MGMGFATEKGHQGPFFSGSSVVIVVESGGKNHEKTQPTSLWKEMNR
jgi:hypothetical protein